MNKKSIKIVSVLTIGLLSTIIFLHWYFGTSLFDISFYPKIDKSKYANYSMDLWLKTIVKTGALEIKTLFPDDTLYLVSLYDLDINTMKYEGFVLLPLPESVASDFIRLNPDRALIAVTYESDFRKNKSMQYETFSITCNVRKNNNGTINDTCPFNITGNIEYEVRFKGKYWKWWPTGFTGFQPEEISNEYLQFKRLY